MRALAIVLVCGCNHLPVTTASAATAAPTPVHEPSLPALVVPQETMQFRITFRGITVAQVQTAIGKEGVVDGHRAVIIKSAGKSAGFVALLGSVRWELETTLDLDRGVPLHSHEESWAELANQHEHDEDRHDWQEGDTRLDLHSAIGTLRGWEPAANEQREVHMQLGGGHFSLTIWRAGHGIVGGRPALRYDGVAAHESHFTIWLSDDAARVPLAAETETPLGGVAIELTDYGQLRE
ncbi:MAG TPA: DUF3108 domain-containing protein [Kofleriaceae bacterium]|nr:DUF3108 domain-containing protein [Kofleriaceae bacterium]